MTILAKVHAAMILPSVPANVATCTGRGVAEPWQGSDSVRAISRRQMRRAKRIVGST